MIRIFYGYSFKIMEVLHETNQQEREQVGVSDVFDADGSSVLAWSSPPPLRPRLRFVSVVAVRRHRIVAILTHLQRATRFRITHSCQ